MRASRFIEILQEEISTWGDLDIVDRFGDDPSVERKRHPQQAPEFYSEQLGRKIEQTRCNVLVIE